MFTKLLDAHHCACHNATERVVTRKKFVVNVERVVDSEKLVVNIERVVDTKKLGVTVVKLSCLTNYDI